MSPSVVWGCRARLEVKGSRGSNPAEVDGFFQDVKILSTSRPGGTFSKSEISGSLKNFKAEKIGF